MQHPCHRCGAPVEDGIPFCRQCSAPQIKVVTTAPPVPEEAVEPQAEFDYSLHPSLEVQPQSIDWRTAFPVIFFVAVPAGLLCLRLDLLFFLWTFGAGALIVTSYRKRTQARVTLSVAVRLGMLTGVVAFLIFLMVFLYAMSRPDFGPALRQQLRADIEKKFADNPDPNVRQAVATLTSPDGFATIFTISIGLLGVSFIFFCVLGALAGATVFAPKSRAP